MYNVHFYLGPALMRYIYNAVATHKTLLTTPRSQQFDPADRRLYAIVDEAHYTTAPSYCHTPSQFNSGIKSLYAVKSTKDTVATLAVSPPEQSIPIIDFSVTFSRHDRLALGSVFDQIAYCLDFLDTIKGQWSYMHPDSAFVHTHMVFMADYTTRDSRVSRQT